MPVPLPVPLPAPPVWAQAAQVRNRAATPAERNVMIGRLGKERFCFMSLQPTTARGAPLSVQGSPLLPGKGDQMPSEQRRGPAAKRLPSPS